MQPLKAHDQASSESQHENARDDDAADDLPEEARAAILADFKASAAGTYVDAREFIAHLRKGR